MSRSLTRVGTSCALLAAALFTPGFAAVEPGAATVADESDLRFEERLVAGGAPGDFITVRHITLRGTNYNIGRKLARIASTRHGTEPAPAQGLATVAQRRYFETNWPQHVDRMRGAAAHFGTSLDDPALAFGSLGYGFSRPGCTVVYYPPDTTEAGLGGVLSRNYDFTTGTWDYTVPKDGEVACTAEPYVVEMYPDDGYASLFLCAYDMLGGAIDGVNSEGLTVALLADDEMMRLGHAERVSDVRAGFNVIQIGRYLLETCADVEEAKLALLQSRLYYSVIPCHYIIADASGRSFVWENSRTLNRSYIIDGEGSPQITTNFMLHLHPRTTDLPEESHPRGSFNRYEAVAAGIEAGRADGLSLDEIKANSHCVAMNLNPPPKPTAPGRTLWHALYYPETSRLDVSFCLGEQEGRDGVQIRRTDYLTFGID